MRYVIQNVKADNFRKMGLRVSETEDGFSVSVNISRFREQIIKAGDGAALDHSEAELSTFRNNRFLNLPYMYHYQTFTFKLYGDNQFTCVVGKQYQNDYKTLQYLIEEHNDFSGMGWWFCPYGVTNKSARK